MAKRFTDSDKWKKPWFRKLSPLHKCFWIYLLDNCDQAGFWPVDFDLAEIFIGAPLDKSEIQDVFKNQYEELASGKKWFVRDFIHFQYGELTEKNRLHVFVSKILAKQGVSTPLTEVPYGAKDKDKDKVKDKVVLEDRKKPFGEEGLVMLTLAEHEKLLVKLGERMTAEYVSRLENYIGSKGKRYASHYHTILSWTRNPSTTKSCDIEKNPMNFNKNQMQNMEALSDFVKRKGTSGPKDLRPGDSNPVLSFPSGKV